MDVRTSKYVQKFRNKDSNKGIDFGRFFTFKFWDQILGEHTSKTRMSQRLILGIHVGWGQIRSRTKKHYMMCIQTARKHPFFRKMPKKSAIWSPNPWHWGIPLGAHTVGPFLGGDQNILEVYHTSIATSNSENSILYFNVR